MVHAREQLDVDGQAAVHVGAWLCNESLGKLALKHEHGAPEHRSVLQQFEHKRRRNLVGRVRNADVEKWHFCFDCVSLNKSELVAHAQLVDSLCNFSNHAWVNFHCNYLFASLKQLNSQVTRTWSNLEDNVSWFNSALLDNLLYYFWVLQDVLAKRFVKFKVVRVSSRLLLLV